jgi:hypothetical protein
MPFRRRRRQPGQHPTGLDAWVFGNVSVDEWVPEPSGSHGDPWDSFARGRAALDGGAVDDAKAIWLAIAQDPGLESRHTLQAWHFLRGVGVTPDPAIAQQLYGAVAEVALAGDHELLAAYPDGRVTYLNRTGAVAIIEGAGGAVDAAATAWLAVAAGLVGATGPWEQPTLPPLPTGHTRITALTPAGPHFGQGPDADLRQDPLAAPFLDAATRLLVAVTDHALGHER